MKPIIESRKDPIWLKDKVWKHRYERTVKLVKESIDALISERNLISLNTIIAKSKDLDDSGKGISRNALINNTEAYEYYKIHCSYKNRSSKRTKKSLEIPNLLTFKPNRDLNRLRKRYVSLTKDELVDRILILEEYICSKEERWLAGVFSNYDS